MRKLMVGAAALALLARRVRRAEPLAATCSRRRVTPELRRRRRCGLLWREPADHRRVRGCQPGAVHCDRRQGAVGRRRCVWRTEEVKLSEDEALVFRAQDCSATPGGAMDLRARRRLRHLSPPEAAGETQRTRRGHGEAVRCRRRADGRAGRASGRWPKRRPTSATSCETKPLTVKVAGRAFELGAQRRSCEAEMEEAHSGRAVGCLRAQWRDDGFDRVLGGATHAPSHDRAGSIQHGTRPGSIRLCEIRRAARSSRRRPERPQLVAEDAHASSTCWRATGRL